MTIYVGYYRESDKYKTEWIPVAESANRKIVKRKLELMIRSDRLGNYYGSRMKILKKEVDTGCGL